MTESTGFVLIHGGGLETWAWDRLTPLLRWPAVAVRRIPPGGNWKSLTLQECAEFVGRQIVNAGLEKAEAGWGAPNQVACCQKTV